MLDMDRFPHGSAGGITRSLRREKSPHRSPSSSKVVTPDLRARGSVVGDLLLGAGNMQMGKQTNALKAESAGKNRIPIQHNVQGSSKIASGIPVKILMEKEMQEHVESKQHSPSVIAKLMGLDPLPAQQPCNMQKRKSVVCLHKRSSEAFLEKHISYEERKQEFKDIFEVLETKAAEKPNCHTAKGLLNSRRREKEIATIQQRLMDAKHLSIDEGLQNSEESSKALEVVGSKDCFVNFFEEPTSLFEKRLRDLRSVPVTPEGSHITILKSCQLSKHESSEICQMPERKRERKTRMKRNSMHKPETDIFIHCLKERTFPHSRELSKSKLGENAEASSLPTRIVVLKPNLEKVQKSSIVQGTSENIPSGNSSDRRQKEFRRSGSLELFSELRGRRVFSDDEEVTCRTKGSGEVAKEIAKHVRHTVGGDCVKSYDPRHSIFHGHVNLQGMPGATSVDFKAVRQTSGYVEGWNDGYSSYLSETNASREARKHLSERWMMTHKFQEVGLAGHGWSTLGEMLALSDREMPDMFSGSLSGQERAHGKFSGKQVLAKWSNPSGISSKDGWKDRRSRNLLRSKSLPTSSTTYGSPNSPDVHGTNRIGNPFMLKDILKLGSRKFSVEKSLNRRFVSPSREVKMCSSTSQPSNSDEEENEVPVREIHVDQNKLVNGPDSKNSPGEEFPLSESTARSISDATCVVDCMLVACCVGSELPDLTLEQNLSQSLSSGSPLGDECSPANHEKEIVAKETSHNQHEANSRLSQTHVNGSACSMIAKEVEQPSPISVLEPPDDNECGPETFERVSADLQGLRMQLKLLKLESRERDADRSVVSDEDAGGEIIDVPVLGGVSPKVGDEEDREFSYLLNVLGDSGFHNGDQGTLSSAFYSPEYPVYPDVFEKLEKNYSGVTWSRAERKLLFDTINSILADNPVLNMNFHPWMKPRRGRLVGCQKTLVEDVWQSLVRQRTEVIGDASVKFMDSMKWLDLWDDIDLIGREVERMLKDDLLEELISEIVSV